jgi:uracil-DNA glycosylase family 4
MSIPNWPLHPASMNEQTEAERATALTALQERIQQCRLCQERGYIPLAQPLVSGRLGDRVMVIGQAPGHRSVAKGRSFSGPGGSILQKWLERAGFPPGYLHNHTYLSSLTRCDPGRNPRGDGDRRPSPAEIALCRPHLEAELRILRPRVVLLVGSMAIETFCGKTRLEKIIGTYREIDGMLFLPLPHPSGVSRWLLAPDHQALLYKALDLLASWRTTYNL